MDEELPVQRWLLRLSQLCIRRNLVNPICSSKEKRNQTMRYPTARGRNGIEVRRKG